MTRRKGLGKGQGKGYKNILMVHDKRVHKDSGRGRKQPQRLMNMNFGQLKSKGIFLRYQSDADKDGVPNIKDCRPLDPTKQDTNIQVGKQFLAGELYAKSNNLKILHKGDKTFLIGYGHAVYGMRDVDTGKVTFFKGWDGYSRTTSKQLTETGLRNADIIEDKKPSTSDLDKFYKVKTVYDVSSLGSEVDKEDMRVINQRAGQHFFDDDTMRFFNSKIETKGMRRGNNIYFISSEQFSHQGVSDPRKYTIRELDLNDGIVETIGEFQQYDSKSSAMKFLKEKVL